MSPDKIVHIHGHMLRRIDIALSVATIIAILFALGTLLYRIADRNDAIDTVCAQVRSVRTALVRVLTDAERANLRRLDEQVLDPHTRVVMEQQIRAFYAPQIDRVRPVHCP